MGEKDIKILKPKDADLKHILFVEKAAFESDEQGKITEQLIKNDMAQPIVSYLAFDEDKPVGHILFSKASVEGYQKAEHIYFLSPVAVIPEYRNENIDKLLMEEGLKNLKKSGIEMVFVYGDPEYYKTHGFVPDAESFGFAPPFPLPKPHAEAWMVQALSNIKGLSKSVGKVVVADPLNKPELWE
jgi:putative acetyltransferase